jgi:hypothetical protein
MENKIIVEMTTLNNLKNNWLIYSIFQFNKATVTYIGLCKLSTFFNLPDLKKLNIDTIGPDDAFAVKVLHICDNKKEAMRLQINTVREAGIPLLNKYGHYKKRKAMIECIETGERWSTINETARAMCIDPGALSRHLRALPGHVTVHGRTYRFVDVVK